MVSHSFGESIAHGRNCSCIDCYVTLTSRDFEAKCGCLLPRCSAGGLAKPPSLTDNNDQSSQFVVVQCDLARIPDLHGFKVRAIRIFKADPFACSIHSTSLTLPLSGSLTILVAAGQPNVVVDRQSTRATDCEIGLCLALGVPNLTRFQMPWFSLKLQNHPQIV